MNKLILGVRNYSVNTLFYKKKIISVHEFFKSPEKRLDFSYKKNIVRRCNDVEITSESTFSCDVIFRRRFDVEMTSRY